MCILEDVFSKSRDLRNYESFFFSAQLMMNAAREEQKKQLEYLLVAHRCAGVTAHTVEKGCTRIRFETSYKGEL